MSRRRLIVTLAVAVPLGVIAVYALGQLSPEAYKKEAGRLAEVMNWQPGSVVGEIGAGEGEITLEASKHVGDTGRVDTTEMDPEKLAHLEELAGQHKNITALKAGETETNLPRQCCDSIYMRLVYHHLTHPGEIDASLFQSLKAGGLLAVIDEEPKPGTSPVEGVPANRGGHGVPKQIVIEELTAAGFQLQKAYDNWPDEHYCVVFSKPGP